MKGKVNKLYGFSLFILIFGFVFSCFFTIESFATSKVKVIIDGKELVSTPSPLIENGRTLIPIRFISEELGAEVDWDDVNKVVTIKKDDKIVRLMIDSRLVLYDMNERTYGLTDVAPKIIDSRTFVPIRLVSNALGIGIEWDQLTRTAYIDSSKSSNITPFFDLNIQSVKSGQTITGKTKLQITLSEKYVKDNYNIRYLLIEPDTAEGFIIARGQNLTDEYIWTPDLRESGKKVLVAAIYDENGQFIAGDAIEVNININPKVELEGINNGETIDSASLGINSNFIATKVEYEIKNLDKDLITIIGQDAPQDPNGKYIWEPAVKDSGNYSLKAIAYDTNGKTYESETIEVKIEVEPNLLLAGVSQGQTIDKPVTLLASRNFDVNKTRYILKDIGNGKEHVLAEKPYGGHTWFPSPEQKGTKEVIVEVEGTSGKYYRSDPIKVNVNGEPIMLLDGVGPNQVLTGPTSLKVRSNVVLDNVNYILINSKTGKEVIIGSNVKGTDEHLYTPTEAHIGYWGIKAVSEYKGREISSEIVPIRIYLGQTYKSLPIIEKEKFLDLASKLALKSWEETGMSAALQTAQSILETGWGQSVPVDKYSGKMSYNLFGIKGKGSTGSVTYNTWEVYNGQTYHVDAEFRAYNSVEESWTDHKSFLLNSSRYEPFKEVMHDSTQGAWALKRTGYATDPEYALKLMRIIKQYELEKLDRVGI